MQPICCFGAGDFSSCARYKVQSIRSADPPSCLSDIERRLGRRVYAMHRRDLSGVAQGRDPLEDGAPHPSWPGWAEIRRPPGFLSIARASVDALGLYSAADDGARSLLLR